MASTFTMGHGYGAGGQDNITDSQQGGQGTHRVRFFEANEQHTVNEIPHQHRNVSHPYGTGEHSNVEIVDHATAPADFNVGDSVNGDWSVGSFDDSYYDYRDVGNADNSGEGGRYQDATTDEVVTAFEPRDTSNDVVFDPTFLLKQDPSEQWRFGVKAVEPKPPEGPLTGVFALWKPKPPPPGPNTNPPPIAWSGFHHGQLIPTKVQKEWDIRREQEQAKAEAAAAAASDSGVWLGACVSLTPPPRRTSANLRKSEQQQQQHRERSNAVGPHTVNNLRPGRRVRRPPPGVALNRRPKEPVAHVPKCSLSSDGVSQGDFNALLIGDRLEYSLKGIPRPPPPPPPPPEPEYLKIPKNTAGPRPLSSPRSPEWQCNIIVQTPVGNPSSPTGLLTDADGHGVAVSHLPMPSQNIHERNRAIGPALRSALSPTGRFVYGMEMMGSLIPAEWNGESIAVSPNKSNQTILL